MARRRVAGLLLALAACIATATAAPTSNHTSLDLYDGAPDGCYYNFQHYGEGDRIMTNEPCLNCTCHNRMLMCYLKVCPFTKPIGQDCTIEKRADQCCPIVTCPDVPVDLLTSTTTSPAEYGPTGMGKLDKFGCNINGKYFPEGSKVPPAPNKPCEHCYCIRNMTTCVMQECTLHVDGCTPIYHKDVCCPVRYSCDHPEDEMPLLDDLSTTVRPTPGFLLTTTTVSPVTQISQDCVYENQVFPDGALIKTEKACDHCYCMKGDIVCVVQECGTPMENEGKNCTALRPREGVCCPDTYICEGDEPTTGTYDAYDRTTVSIQEELTTLSPPRRTSSEGSGYRNEPDEPYTELPSFEPEIEGSGEEEPIRPSLVTEKPLSVTSESIDEILTKTDDSHEFIPLTTVKSSDTAEVTELTTVRDEANDLSQSQDEVPSTTTSYTVKQGEEFSTDSAVLPQEFGSGEPEENISPSESATTTIPSILDTEITTEITKKITDAHEIDEKIATTESQIHISSETEYEPTSSPQDENLATSEIDDSEIFYTTKSTSPHELVTTNIPVTQDVEETSQSAESTMHSSTIGPETIEGDVDHYAHITTPSTNLDDEYITTESQEKAEIPEKSQEPETIPPNKHVTTSTPMLEEVEKDTTEFTESDRVPSDVTQDGISKPNIIVDNIPEEKHEITTMREDHPIYDGDFIGTTDKPLEHHDVITTTEASNVPETTTTNLNENYDDRQNMPQPNTSTLEENEMLTAVTPDESTLHGMSRTTISTLEIESGTTEPDKGLNTIPSGSLEEDSSVPYEEKTTTAPENFTSESDLDSRFSDDISGIKQTTAPSILLDHSEETFPATTESEFRKEDGPTEDKHGIPELTTIAADMNQEVTSTLPHEVVKTTESNTNIQQESIATSEQPIYHTENVKETTLTKERTTVSNYESSTEKDLNAGDMTTMKSINDIVSTTVANQEDNEIFNEPRIPGEGDCLLNGITYSNESTVPSSNKCQSGCRCVSSIIKCDPILCSLPPEMDNCEAIYDSPDACCPTYVCDHKSETRLPESHSQMSGTESPTACNGNECMISEDKNQPEKPSDIATGCTGDTCEPALCTHENGCQTIPVASCSGESCNIPHEIKPEESSQTCSGEDCKAENIPTNDCNVDGCNKPDIEPGHVDSPKACSDKETCHNIPEVDDSKLDQSSLHKCPGPDCETTLTEIESSTTFIIDQTYNDINKSDQKSTAAVTEISDKQETTTMSYQQTTVNENSNIPITRVTPDVEHMTSLYELDKHDIGTTTKSSNDLFNEEEYTTEETEMKLPEGIENSQELSPVSTENTLEYDESKKPVFDETPSKTVKPEDVDSMITAAPSHLLNAETPEIHPQTISVESIESTSKYPEENTYDLPTSHSHDISSPSGADLIDYTEKILSESSTPYSTDSLDNSDSTRKSIDEITESSKLNEPAQEVTETPEKSSDDTTIQPQENITESPESFTESKHDGTTKSPQPESVAETTNLMDSEDSRTTSILFDDTHTETSTDMTQKETLKPIDIVVTTPAKESETVNEVITESSDSSKVTDRDSSKTTVTESQENIIKEHDSNSIEEDITKPSISEIIVDEVTKSSSEVYNDITPGIIDVEISTELPNAYNTETESPKEDITKYTPEEPIIVTETSTTVKLIDEFVTVPAKPFQSSPADVSSIVEEGSTTSPISEEGSTEKYYTEIPHQDNKLESSTKSTHTEDLEQKTTTIIIGDAPVTQQLQTDSTVQMDNTKKTTTKVLEETATESISSLSNELEDKTATTFEAVKEVTTELPKMYVTESSEPAETTIKAVDLETGTTRIPEMSNRPEIDLSTETVLQVTKDNNLESLKPTLETPGEDEIPSKQEITTTQEVYTTEAIELTPPSLLDNTRRTEPELTQPSIITETPSAPESSSPQNDTSVPDTIVESTIAPINAESQQTNIENIVTETESENTPDSETQEKTTRPTIVEVTDTSNSDLLETTTREDSNQHTTPGKQESSESIESLTNISTNDLTTTSSETQDITTLKPMEVFKEPTDIDMKTEHPAEYTTVFEYTEGQTPVEILNQPAGEVITELPIAVTDLPSTTITEKEISNIPLDSDTTNESEISVDDRYSPETTEQSLVHKADETIKPVEESLITEKSDFISTEPSDFEEESNTQSSVEVSSIEPEKEITLTEESIVTDSTKPDLEETTKSPLSHQMTTIIDTNIEKQGSTLSPAFITQDEIATTLSDQLLTTLSSTKLPPIEVVTETIEPVSSISENQESLTKDQAPAKKLEPSTTEATSDRTMSVDTTPPTSQQPGEVHEVSNTSQGEPEGPNLSDVETEETQRPVVSTTGAPKLSDDETNVSVEQQTVSSDQVVTDASEPTKHKSELITTENPDTHIALEPITTPKDELDQNTVIPTEDTKHTHKEDDMSKASETTTQAIKFTDNILPTSEAFTEKQPESIHASSSEASIPIEQYLTTEKPYDVPVQDISTSTPTRAEEITTPSFDISPSVKPEEEQSIPVIVPEINEASPPKESDLLPTERITQATEKPASKTTVLEDEFILATSKATTVKEEEAVPTSSPLPDYTVKSTEKAEELVTTTAPESPKPDVVPTDELSVPDEDGSFPPSGSTGYGQEPDYVEEDQTFGPGTCRYGGKVYVSAQQIPRDDPCDFCFCFRSDIICLQQSCPPPIHGCHEEPIQGFCCPRYECPVSMATTVNVTTTTTTTTTTLPPHFPTHSYKGSAQRRGCQIKGQIYKVGEVVRASSGPCLHCTCGGDGQMKCDPKVCTPEPMLRQMIAAAVSAKRRR